MVLSTLSNQKQWMSTNFSETNPSFDNKPTRSPGFSSIGKIKSDCERAKVVYNHLTNNMNNIAMLHEHQLRNNKKPVGEEKQKSINPSTKGLFGPSSSDSLDDLSFMKTRSKVSLGNTTSVELEEFCSSIEAWFVTEQYISGVDEHTHALNASNYHDVLLLSEGEGLTAISECVSTPRKHKIPVVEETTSQEVKERKPRLTKETKIQVENMLRELAISELTQFYMVELPNQRRRTLTNILEETSFETNIQVENMLRELAISELTQFYMVELPIQRRRTLTNVLQEKRFENLTRKDLIGSEFKKKGYKAQQFP